MARNNVEVGRFTYGDKKIQVRRWGSDAKLRIGSFCSIADGVSVLLGGNHRVDWATTFPFGHVFIPRLGGEDIVGHPASNGDVVIGNDVWIATGSTIISGVTIGDDAVIGANSNVVSDVAPYTVVGGNPAKLIKKRFEPEISDLLLELRWWELDIAVIKEIAPVLSTPPEAKVLRSLIKAIRS
jgi:acetyltransferase-like isoleucine patch superfamily enzyme